MLWLGVCSAPLKASSQRINARAMLTWQWQQLTSHGSSLLQNCCHGAVQCNTVVTMSAGWKVLQPAKSIKIFLGFPPLAPTVHVLLHASHAAGPKVTSNFLSKRSPLNTIKIFQIAAPPNTKLNSKLNFFPLLHPSNNLLPSTSSSSLPKPLPCLQTTFDTRTSGHCVGTFSFLLSYSSTCMLLQLRTNGNVEVACCLFSTYAYMWG